MRSTFTDLDVDWEPCEDSALADEYCAVRESDGTVYLASREVLDRCETFPLGAEAAARLLGEAKAYQGRGTTLAFTTEVQGMFLAFAGHRWAGELQDYWVVLESGGPLSG